MTDKDALDGIPTFDIEAERALLGALLIDPQLMAEIADQLHPDAFYRVAHSVIIRAMLALHQRSVPVDVVTLSGELDDTGAMRELDGGDVYLFELVNATPTSLNAQAYLDRVRTLARRRTLGMLHAKAASMLYVNGDEAYKRFMAENARTFADGGHDDGARKPFLSIDDVFALPDLEWVIDGVLPAQSTAALVADSGVGKSFLAWDWALRCATGRSWLGRNVQRGHIYFMAGEGIGDMKYRLQAWCQHHGVAPGEIAPFVHIDTEATPLLNASNVSELIARLRNIDVTDAPLRLVVIDTLSCATIGGDLNDNRVASEVVAAAKAIRDATGATVLFLHHTNKQEGGYRGASALKGDIDAMLSLKENGDVLELRPEKLKYADRGKLCVNLRRHIVPLTDDGAISSCVIVSTQAAPKEEELTPNARKALIALCEKWGGPSATYAQWEKIADIKNLDRYIRQLTARGLVVQDGNAYAPTEKAMHYPQPPSFYPHEGIEGWSETVGSLPSVPSPPYRGEGTEGKPDALMVEIDATPSLIAHTASQSQDGPHVSPHTCPMCHKPAIKLVECDGDAMCERCAGIVLRAKSQEYATARKTS